MSVPAESMDGLEIENAQRERFTTLINAIDAAAETAYGSDEQGELARERGLSIDFYLGKNVEPAPEGRSQVVDRSVFETIQWILPSLLRIYAGGGNVVEFEPLGPDDEQQAEQESDYLNYIVTQKNRWFDICLQWFQDALLTKNSYCLAYVEEYYRAESEKYEQQSDQQISYLLSEEGTEVVEHTAYPDQSQPPQPVIDPNTGQPAVDPMTGLVMTQPVMLHDIVIRCRKPEKKLCFRVLPPERVKVSDKTPSHTLEECDYFEYWENVTISSIRQMGFAVDNDVSADIDTDSEEDDARNLYSEDDGQSAPNDPSMRRVKLRTIWIRHDTDGDGIAELQRVIRLGNDVLLRQEESRIPVSSIVPYILTHRHMGMSMTDITLDLQRIMTAVMRQGLDNLYQSNNVRWAHTAQVNLDDLLSSSPGGTVEVEGNPAENLMPLVPPFLFPQAIQGLEYLDTVKEKRTGVNKMFSGVDENAVRQTATGISQLSTMAAQRVEQIARVFAPGIEYLFSVAHELLLKHGHKNDVVKLRGNWVEVDPSTWKTGRDLKVSVGFGAGNKDMLVARLMNVWTLQTQALQSGLPIVTPKDLYETAAALVKASDFTTNRFFTPPEQIPPPPPPPPTPEQLMYDIEQKKLAADQEAKAAEIQSTEKIKAADIEFGERKANLDAEVKIKLEKLKQGQSVDEPQMAANPLVDALTQLSQAQQAQSAQMAQVAEKIAAAIEAANAPKEVIRGKDGKVQGVRVKRDG